MYDNIGQHCHSNMIKKQKQKNKTKVPMVALLSSLRRHITVANLTTTTK